MLVHPFRNARVIFATVAVCFVMLTGLAMPITVGAEKHSNQTGPSDGQRFCLLLGGTKVPDGLPEATGGFRSITCLLADGNTRIECTITTSGKLNDCERRG